MSFIKAVSSLAGQRGITTKAIYESLGISQQRMSYWLVKGWIEPSIRRGKPGTVSLWSIYDLLDIKTIVGLRRTGLSMQKIVKVIEWLKANGYALHSAELATNGEHVWINLDDQTIEILEHTDQLILLDWRTIVQACLALLESEGVDI